MAEDLLRTPLYATHVQWGGKMVDFAGWSMPLSFEGIQAEHVHTRNAASLFDVSHMGRLSLTGVDATRLLDRLFTRNLSQSEIGRCYYGHICRDDGGILDDVIASRFEDHWGIVCNGANRSKIVDWIQKHSVGCDATLKDETTSTAMIAIQGPETMNVASRLAGPKLDALKRYRFLTFEFLGMRIVVYRTGYTGEEGVEVVLPAGAVNMLLPSVLGSMEAPHETIRPAGLGARDTLRLEAGMPLYGHELTEEWDSLSAGQDWCVDLDKDFIGGEAMRAHKDRGVSRRIMGLTLEGRRIARQGFEVYRNGRCVGQVTSGTLSPTLGKSIAMGLLEQELVSPDCALEVDFKSKRVEAQVTALPFYRRPKN